MSEEKGIVLNIRNDGWAEVITERQDACSGCGASHCCVAFGQGNKMVTKAINEAKAQVGDLVTLTLQTGQVIKSATAVYLVPIQGFIAGAITGGSVHNAIGLSESAGAILLGFAGLAGGYLIALFISKSMTSRGKLNPVITSVIQKGVASGLSIKEARNSYES